MGYLVPVNLEAFVWGFIVVQERVDAGEFASLLRGDGLAEHLVAHLVAKYEDDTDFGGYCHVTGTHKPWAIVVIQKEPHRVFKTFAHELMHLVDMLSVSFDATGREVRARIAGDVMGQFYAHTADMHQPTREELTADERWDCLMKGAFAGATIGVLVFALGMIIRLRWLG